MQSECEIECPKCGFRGAVHYREFNSIVTRILCVRCGLYKMCDFPEYNEPDSKLQCRLLGMGKGRLNARARAELIKSYIWPAIYILVALIVFRDPKLIAVLIGILIFLEARVKRDPIHRQLTYMLRLAQYRHLNDDYLGKVLSNDLAEYGLTKDYSLGKSEWGRGDEARLRAYYDAHALWFEASLRSVGCSEEEVTRQSSEYRVAMKNATREEPATSHVREP